MNLPGWTPINNSAQFENVSKLCPAPWRYTSPEDLQLISSWGFFTVYDGGGYVADLGYSKDTAGPLISSLRQKGWIDRHTRAVLLEFTIYNPYTGYLSISTYYYEILPTGYGNTFPRIDTVLLTSTESGLYQFYLFCQLFYIMLVFLFIIKQLYRMFRQRRAYFRNVWNVIEILQLISSSLVVAFYVIKSKLILKRISTLKENPFVPVSFQDVIIWNEAENVALAFAVFIATLKLLRMIRFNPHVIILLQSFRVSRELLVSYSVLFVVIFISYAQLGRVALGSNMYRYSTFVRTLAAELLMCLGGDMQFRELQGIDRVLGPFFSVTFVSLMSFIFVNFFVAILNESYEDARENTDRESEEFEMADFIMEQLAGMLGFGRKHSEQENKDKEITAKGSLPLTKSSLTSDIKPQQKSGELSKMAEHSPVSRHKMIRPRRNNKPLEDNLKNESRKPKEKQVVIDIECESKENEEHILQKLDSLTATIAKDAIREDVELLCFIWLLSDEKRRVPKRTTVLQIDAGENSSTSSIACISLNSDNTYEQCGAFQNEAAHGSADHLGSQKKSQPSGSIRCW